MPTMTVPRTLMASSYRFRSPAVFRQTSRALLAWPRYPKPEEYRGYHSPAPAAGFPPKRRPMTVYNVSCPPAEAVARCVAFWRAVGIKRESTTMCKRFAMTRLVGHRDHGHARAGRDREWFRDRHFPDDLSDLPPACCWQASPSTWRERQCTRSYATSTRRDHHRGPASARIPRSRHRAVVFPVGMTAIRGPRLTKDPLDRVFAQLEHTSSPEQGILLAPPRLVNGKGSCPATLPSLHRGASRTMHRDARYARSRHQAFRSRR